MSSARWLSHPGCLALVGSAALLCVGIANAQTPAFSETHAATVAEAAGSSSMDYNFVADAAEPAAPAPAAGGQYDNKSSQGSSDWKGRLALEFGAGFDMPVGNTSNYSNHGFPINVGGGLHFSHGLSLLAEYTFISNGLPSGIAAQAGVDGGNIHVWGFSVDPVVDLMPHHNTSVYVTGGGGFYRKTTNFQVQTAQTFCTYFYCGVGYTPQTVGHFSSNQGGWNVGGGLSHRFAGTYGDGRMAVFAEARYLYVDSPAIVNQSANGLGNTTIGAGTRLVPITFGLRF